MSSFSTYQIRFTFALFAACFLLSSSVGFGQTAAQPTAANTPAQSPAQTSDQNDPTLAPPAPPPAPEQHGRKYKAPPVTSHIEVMVTGGFNAKPITDAAVIFHPLSATGKDTGSYEVKTDLDGKAMIDVIPQGTTVILQIIAPSYDTYGDTYQITNLNQDIDVRLERPRSQYSVYSEQQNNTPEVVTPGVQEPAAPLVPKPPPTAGALPFSAVANQSANKDLTGITSPYVPPNPDQLQSSQPQIDTTPAPANPAGVQNK